ncbi:MAG: ferric iron uptake transcriptional regulator [Gammaproteobacteria bacterium]|nr:ferric iron uptake transcriptional regulator [Gammaproteobacteria bacterium]
MSESSELKKAGLKATMPRLKILNILENTSNAHMTAEDVYKLLLDAGEEVGLATVYRVLTQFESAGLVMRHNFEGGRAVYEIDKGHHHDHMVCVKCGKVFEFVDDAIEARQDKISREAGFVIEDHSLSLYGMCEGMKKNGVCSKQ